MNDVKLHTSIPTSYLEELKQDAAMLNALREAGVDNWEGYGDAMMEIHNGND
jgi:hypothetical protein